jgi:enoyl-CoA hydratase/carnithine racemase
VTYKTITYKKEKNLAFITLNRPEVLNALNRLMLEEIRDAVKELAADKDVVVGVLNSAAEKGFSAGIDVAYVKDMDSWGARGMGNFSMKPSVPAGSSPSRWWPPFTAYASEPAWNSLFPATYLSQPMTPDSGCPT